jgi:glycogen operon protein
LIAQLTMVRRRYPQIKPRNWLVGKRPDGARDIIWLTPKATEMSAQDWDFAEGRFLSYILAPVEDSPGALFIVLNAAEQPVDFILPAEPAGKAWTCVLATVPLGTAAGASPDYQAGKSCRAPARSVTVFASAS